MGWLMVGRVLTLMGGEAGFILLMIQVRWLEAAQSGAFCVMCHTLAAVCVGGVTCVSVRFV